MRRRSYLHFAAALIVSVAGCLSVSGSDPEDDEANDAPESGRPAGGDGNQQDDDPDDSSAEACSAPAFDRVDEPPYAIERPDVDDPPRQGGDSATGEPEEWNEHFLGEQMAAEPSVPFERIDDVAFADVLPGRHGSEVYVASLLTDREDLDAIEARSPSAERALQSTDFDEQALVVVATGTVSSSREHRWKRVETTTDGLHLHGYYLRPYEQLDDLTVQYSAVRVDVPADHDVESARVSLTTGDDRVHVDSTEEVVVLAEECDDGGK